jgi:hypothetical protein
MAFTYGTVPDRYFDVFNPSLQNSTEPDQRALRHNLQNSFDAPQDPMKAESQKLIIPVYASDCPRSERCVVRVNGEPVFTYRTNVAEFTSVAFTGRVEVEVEMQKPISKVVIRPLRCAVNPAIEGRIIRFTLEEPKHLMIDIEGQIPLLFYGNSIETDFPSESDPNVRFFKAGTVYCVDEIRLKDNETLYIEAGAVVKGCVRATGARGVTIRGQGILDGNCPATTAKRKMILLEGCEDVTVRDIVMIEPSTWMLVFAGCRGVVIRNLKEIGECVCSDGIDVVGSRDVLIEGCFLKNNDDCIVIKSLQSPEATVDWIHDVVNVTVSNCVLMNDRAGNATEIGHELRTGSIRNITFRDCDILHVHGSGAAFSIHNGDHGTVSDVCYENIRIEHCWDKLVDFRIMRSRYNPGTARGQVRNISLKNVEWMRATVNEGYTISVIGGWDAQHTIECVSFENFTINGVKANNADDLDIFTKHAHGITFS